MCSTLVACSAGDRIVESGFSNKSADATTHSGAKMFAPSDAGIAVENEQPDDPADPGDDPVGPGGDTTGSDDGPPLPGCTPNCLGKHCGFDGCGGSCGICPAGSECDAAGKCECVPSCDGKQCGTDGCGGDCGDCGSGTYCQDNQCICQPSCAGKQCGDDGCGGSCGGCPQFAACQGTICVCQPTCAGKQCGSDGCNGSCGGCLGGKVCKLGSCVCEPKCGGKQCGDDGCGGQCGSCDSFQACKTGQCIGWKWEVESNPAIGHEQGKKEGDGWACNTGEHSKNYMVYGPYIKDVPAGAYKAIFRMMIDNNTAGSDKVARIEAFNANSNKIISSQSVYRNQFNSTMKYQDFPLVFQTYGGDSLEFRIQWLDTAYIRVDRVLLQP